MSRILVTGGAGFIGSHLVDYLVLKKHSVTVIDDLSTGLKKNINPHSRFIHVQVQDVELYSIFKKYRFDFVYHLAAQKNLQYSLRKPIEDAQTNIIGSLRVIEAAKSIGAKKIIFFSSAAVYDSTQKPPNREAEVLKPITPYGISKRVVEDYIINSGLKYTIIRPSNVYGPRQDASGEGGVVAIFCQSILNSNASYINNTGKQTRDFIYVKDVIRAAYGTVTKGNNAILNISTNQETSINKLYSLLTVISNYRNNAKTGRKISEQFRSRLDNSEAKKILAWTPKTKLPDGLRLTFQWLKTHE